MCMHVFICTSVDRSIRRTVYMSSRVPAVLRSETGTDKCTGSSMDMCIDMCVFMHTDKRKDGEDMEMCAGARGVHSRRWHGSSDGY